MKYILMILLVLSPLSYGQSSENIASAIKSGEIDVKFRYRLEAVDQDLLSKNALASTLLSRFTYQSNQVRGLSIGLEVDNVSNLGAQKYNDTINGNTLYPVVADPDATDINQYYAKYSSDVFVATAGRQRINHQNQRFVGGVAWRQNEQTYDGYRIQWQVLAKWNVDYSYLHNVNRVFGPNGNNANLAGNFHLINNQLSLTPFHKLSVFGYWLDFDDSKTLSSQTLGFDYNGSFKYLSWHGAYAQQTDYKENPESFLLDYWAWDVKLNLDKSAVFTGQEVLEGNGTIGFSTPLATLHKFQGFADKFLVTPVEGLRDSFVGISHQTDLFNVALTFHSFKNLDSEKLGSEVNMSMTYRISESVNLLLKHANYRTAIHQTDTQKWWLQLSINV